MILSGESNNKSGGIILNRITWYKNQDDTVRQHWEVTKDDEENWSTAFDGLYKK